MATPLPHRYLIALGANLGDREAMLARAVALIGERVGPVAARAKVYETAPVGAADQTFLNSALVCESALGPDETLAALLAIETEMGRVRREKWGNRTIDLDVLMWEPEPGASRAWSSPTLTIPHPHLLDRDFALVPACDVAGDWRHPTTGRTLADERAARGYDLTTNR